jgi:hypothetical protein
LRVGLKIKIPKNVPPACTHTQTHHAQHAIFTCVIAVRKPLLEPEFFIENLSRFWLMGRSGCPDPGGSFASVTAARRFQEQKNGRQEAMIQIHNGHGVFYVFVAVIAQ